MQGHPDGQVLEAVSVRSSGGNADKGATPLRPEAASPIASSQAYERNLRLKHPHSRRPAKRWGWGEPLCRCQLHYWHEKPKGEPTLVSAEQPEGQGRAVERPPEWVYRRGLKLEETYATMNVGNPSIRPARTGLPAVEVMLGSRRSHSSLRTGKPSTWRRAPVVRTKKEN